MSNSVLGSAYRGACCPDFIALYQTALEWLGRTTRSGDQKQFGHNPISVIRESDSDVPVYQVGRDNILSDTGRGSETWKSEADRFFERNSTRVNAVGVIRKGRQKPGTVFYIGDDLIVSCAHVFAPIVRDGKLTQSLRIYFGHRDETRLPRERRIILPIGHEVAIHPKYLGEGDIGSDIAVLRGGRTSPNRALKQLTALVRATEALSASSPELSKPAYVLGYPAENEDGRTISKFGLLNLAKASAFRLENKRHAMIFHSANTQPGNSGSPLLDIEGKVIGIHRGWEDADFDMPRSGKFNQAVSATLLNDWIDELRNDPGVPWLTRETLTG